MLVPAPDLLARWADAGATSRGAAMPVARGGGLYIHVDQPDQVGRYLFARLEADSIGPLAASVDRPLLYLKVCAPAEMVAPLLPLGWEMHGLPAATGQPLAMPHHLLQHRALLEDAQGRPFSALVETYTEQVLAFPPPAARQDVD